MIDPLVYEKLTAYCAYRERCISEVKQKLKRLTQAETDAITYINKLQQENYLNEERYVKAFVSGHIRKKWGKTKITAALRQKGINAALIQIHLTPIDETDYREQLLKAAAQKLKSLKTGTGYEKKIKLVRFLLGKGYESSMVDSVAKELMSKQ
ncbi:MAG: regulatory protein RecX [Chitinophagales bacterium]|nr:regulatory protein RecX [Chitinophagales bacterium]